MAEKYGWTDIENIALDLCEAYPDLDPKSIRFTQLRKLVESLADFQADPDHHVNEQILEAVQAAWIEEREGIERDEDEPPYSPPNPFRPEA